MKKNNTEYELSRPLLVDKISAGGIAEHLVANASERAALAKRFGLIQLLKLEANLNIDPTRGRMYAVTGVVNADVVQQCVVSLDPLPAHIEDKIDVLFAPPHMLEPGAGPPHLDPSDEEAPEPIVNGVIDLGELVAQHLAMAIDPYPRKEGASPPPMEFAPETTRKTGSNPFAKLAELKPTHRK